MRNPMNLTIWRHGEARRGAVDRLRPLTESGCDDIGFGCRQFHQACGARAIPHPGLILYSPWERTARTAEIIAAAFTHADARAEAALQPGSDAAAVDRAIGDAIETAPDTDHILLVSHQPLVSWLVAFYIGDSGQPPPLPPGGLVTVSFDVIAAHGGTLRFWAMPPEYEAGI